MTIPNKPIKKEFTTIQIYVGSEKDKQFWKDEARSRQISVSEMISRALAEYWAKEPRA